MKAITTRFNLKDHNDRLALVKLVRHNATISNVTTPNHREVDVDRMLKTIATGNLNLLKQLAIINYTIKHGYSPRGDTQNFWATFDRERGDVMGYAEIAYEELQGSEHDFLQVLVYDLCLNPSKARHYLSAIIDKEQGRPAFDTMNGGTITEWIEVNDLNDCSIR